jgi:hypothetical protein
MDVYSNINIIQHIRPNDIFRCWKGISTDACAFVKKGGACGRLGIADITTTSTTTTTTPTSTTTTTTTNGTILAVREKRNTPLQRTHGVRAHLALVRRGREEEGGGAAAEIVVEVDEEGEEGGLFLACGRVVVDVGVGGGVDG